MASRRFYCTLPKDLDEKLQQAAAQEELTPSAFLQDAVLAHCQDALPDNLLAKRASDLIERKLTFGSSAYQVLVLWSRLTGQKKSVLLTYSLQKALKGR